MDVMVSVSASERTETLLNTGQGLTAVITGRHLVLTFLSGIYMILLPDKLGL
jgi:hypothetical protein